MRKIAVLAVAALLALASGAQVLSSALSDSRPALAASLSPYAARAQERQASLLITADEQTQEVDVSAAAPHAAAAVANHLLATEALAVLALAQDDAERRDAMVAAGLAVNRRGRLLNSAAMVSSIEREDTEALLAALNRLLLLYPTQKEATIPLLIGQLDDPRMVPGFVELLAPAPEWAADFWVQAASNDAVAQNVAAIRLAMPVSTQVGLEADKAILRMLTRTRQFAEAGTLFARIHDVDQVPVTRGELGWAAEYVPFEWQFYDQQGRYARPSADGESLTLSVRPGYGGLLARRLVRLGGASFFEVRHSLDPASASRVRLSLQCPDSDPVWSDTLGPSPTGMRVDGAPACDYAWLNIEARATAGSPEISGQILGIVAR